MARPGSQVCLVDDDASVRAGLARLLEKEGYAVRTFASAREFLEQRPDDSPACLILDLQLPDVNGLDLFQQLKAMGFAEPVIFLTGFGDIPTSVRAIKAGAADFLTKPVERKALLHAIEQALERHTGPHPPGDLRELASRYTSLTPRERQVMELLLSGRLNKQVAHELGIAEKTVKVHRSRVMAKMGARRFAHLIQYAVRLGHLPDAPPPAEPPSAPGTPRHAAGGAATYGGRGRREGERLSRRLP